MGDVDDKEYLNLLCMAPVAAVRTFILESQDHNWIMGDVRPGFIERAEIGSSSPCNTNIQTIAPRRA